AAFALTGDVLTGTVTASKCPKLTFNKHGVKHRCLAAGLCARAGESCLNLGSQIRVGEEVDGSHGQRLGAVDRRLIAHLRARPLRELWVVDHTVIRRSC